MESGLNPASVNRKITSLKSFFRYLQKQKIVAENPAVSVPLPKLRKKLPGFVEENRLNQLLDNDFFNNDFIGTRDKLIITLLYGAGIRLSELTGLKDSDIDIKLTQIKVLGKRNKERIIPYPVPVNSLLEEYWEKRRSI